MTNVLLQTSALPSKNPTFFSGHGRNACCCDHIGCGGSRQENSCCNCQTWKSLFPYWQDLCSDLWCWEVHYFTLEFNSLPMNHHTMKLIFFSDYLITLLQNLFSFFIFFPLLFLNNPLIAKPTALAFAHFPYTEG